MEDVVGPSTRSGGQNIERAEKEFNALKEKYFGDKIKELDREYDSLQNMTHQGLMLKVTELDELKSYRVHLAKQTRELQIQNIENEYQAEKKQAEDEHQTEMKLLRERMMADTMEKWKKLEAEKDSLL